MRPKVCYDLFKCKAPDPTLPLIKKDTIVYIRLLSIIIVAMLTGCAQQPKKQPMSPTKPQVTQKAQVETEKEADKETNKPSKIQKTAALAKNWQARGRLAASNGGKGGNAQFVWTQKGDSYQIKLFGPFGSGSVYITGHPTFVELQETNGKKTRAQSPEQLLKKIAGWQVPVTGLRYWMRGIPSPNSQASSQSTNAAGNLQHLAQQGWHIVYESYQEGNPALPNKLRLQNGKVKLKMIVTEWEAI